MKLVSLLTLFKRERKHEPADFLAPEDRSKPPEKKGLEKGFVAGEKLPWRGIWFELIEVKHDRLTLRPISMTFKRAKAIKEAS